MNLSAPFIERPVATTLLTIGVALAGFVSYLQLPVAPLPQVDFPTITVQASLPGASPEVMATSVATPLERHLGQIADVTELTSQSTVGSTRITLQFGLDRNIDGAARDVQAGINAAHADLPVALKSNPTYRKVNPADAPIMILALTSKTLTQGQLYDAAATILEQKLSQFNGVGQVTVGGSSLPAVRVELNPRALFKYGIGLEDVRAALSAANANSPKGAIESDGRHFQLYTNDQAPHAADYRNLLVAYRNGRDVRLSDVADVQDSVEDLRNQGLFNGQPSVVLIISKQPNANIIQTIDGIRAALPDLKASLPSDVEMAVALDRSPTIRASLHDVERTLLLSIFLVIMVVFIFLREPRATLVPSVAVPVSLLGTFGIMYLLGYTLDNLSLMALTVATGFVVDDAIVVMENIARHIEDGVPRYKAALLGAQEVGFTVLSMSISLVAVFLPILLMGGIVGRLFREFAVTLSVAILVSLIVSLTTTPMMCARILNEPGDRPHSRFYNASERFFNGLLARYEIGLGWALKYSGFMLAVFFVTIALNIYLYVIVPKGFFPQQDTGAMLGNIQADQSISFQLMRQKLQSFVDTIKTDPAVATVVGYTGGGQTNSGFLYVTLKPLAERKIAVDGVINRLRPKLSHVPGAQLFLQAAQDIRVGGRMGNAQYQYTLQADSLADLQTWTPKLTEALQHNPALADVNSDQQNHGLETELTIDRPSASRLDLNASQIDNTLYDAFGQRQVSVIYNPLNQYHVVMEVAPSFWQNPDTLKEIYVSTAGGTPNGTATTGAVAGTVTIGGAASNAATNTTSNAGTATAYNSASQVTPAAATTLTTAATNLGIGNAGSASTSTGASPTAASVANDTARNLSANSIANTGKGSASSGAAVSSAVETVVPLPAFSQYGPGTTPLAVNHQGQFAANTITFNLPPGKSLGDAVTAINQTMASIGMPQTVQGSFQGTAKVFQQSLDNQGILILAALGAVYIVLGILYESYIHPLTILSTLPSAGIGAVLALMICGQEFSLIALIGIILLIGIVKKNAIMMIDFALAAERTQNLSSRDAIYQACLLRFRPIMMTTCAALLGALPLAIGMGEGSELRRPLGISIVGGLLVSQALTLFTTPVIYLYLDRMRLYFTHGRPGIPRASKVSHAT
jgi:multidrug efflux pump